MKGRTPRTRSDDEQTWLTNIQNQKFCHLDFGLSSSPGTNLSYALLLAVSSIFYQLPLQVVGLTVSSCGSSNQKSKEGLQRKSYLLGPSLLEKRD